MTFADAMAQNPHWWQVTVLDDEIESIDKMGLARLKNGMKHGWHSKTADLKSDWHLAGIRGEWAVSLVLELPLTRVTSDKVNDLRQGDLSHFVEVKARRELDPRRWDLAVNEDQIKPDRIYVLTLTCFWPRAVIVCGWAWGKEVAAGERFTHGVNNHGFRVLKYKSLRNIKAIFDLPEWRKQKGLI